MNILLTGGSGFIGKNIRESLSHKYNILSPSHKELDWMDEFKVRSFFRENRIDSVIHAAWKPGHRNAKDFTDLIYANMRIFQNLMRNRDYYSRLINLGSGSVYDMRYYIPKMKEEYFDNSIPVDAGGFIKYNCTKQIELNERCVDLRLFGVFGKYEDYAIRFISNAICKVVKGLPITIKQNRKFDYLFIDDLMTVLEFFIHNDCEYKAYNVTPDESIDLYSLAEIVNRISGKDLPIIVGQPGMGSEYSGSNLRLKREVHNLKFTPIDHAVEKLYSWYVDNRDLIDHDLLLTDK